jgi:hypothetical protein
VIKAVSGLVANKQLVDSPKRLQQTLSVDVLFPPQADFSPLYTKQELRDTCSAEEMA